MENEPENEKKTLQAHYPESVSKEAVIRKLAEEGMMLTVDKLQDVTQDSLINAAYNVIENLQKRCYQISSRCITAEEENKKWYRAALRANILVSRNNKNEIVLNLVQSKELLKDIQTCE